MDGKSTFEYFTTFVTDKQLVNYKKVKLDILNSLEQPKLEPLKLPERCVTPKLEIKRLTSRISFKSPVVEIIQPSYKRASSTLSL